MAKRANIPEKTLCCKEPPAAVHRVRKDCPRPIAPDMPAIGPGERRTTIRPGSYRQAPKQDLVTTKKIACSRRCERQRQHSNRGETGCFAASGAKPMSPDRPHQIPRQAPRNTSRRHDPLVQRIYGGERPNIVQISTCERDSGATTARGHSADQDGSC